MPRTLFDPPPPPPEPKRLPRRRRAKERERHGEVEYRCPFCKKWVSLQDCEVMGADPDCLFCPECNQEFRQ